MDDVQDNGLGLEEPLDRRTLLGKAAAEKPIGRARFVKNALRRGAEQLGCSIEPVELDENSSCFLRASVPHRRECSLDMAAADVGRNPDRGFQSHCLGSISG